MPGPVLVVHLVPTQAALGLVQVDPVTYARERALPALGTTLSGARLNVDGALGVHYTGAAGTNRYSQFFRNGFFETVQVLEMDRMMPSGRVNLPSLSYEQELITLLERFRLELEHIGVGQELTCMLSLTDATSVELGIDRFRFNLAKHQGFFDRKILVLPDVLLPADLSAKQALRPLFDLVWQSAGLGGSNNYNEAGEWAPRGY